MGYEIKGPVIDESPGNEDKLKGLDPILPTVTFVGGFDRPVGSESKGNLSQT